MKKISFKTYIFGVAAAGGDHIDQHFYSGLHHAHPVDGDGGQFSCPRQLENPGFIVADDGDIFRDADTAESQLFYQSVGDAVVCAENGIHPDEFLRSDPAANIKAVA